MSDTPLELAAQRVRQLEAEAMEMHDRAQALNKAGRFQEAQEAYAAMHALEDEASALAARVGCVACVLGDQGEQDAGPSLCNLDPAVLLPYERLHTPAPWPHPTRGDGAAAAPAAQPTAANTWEAAAQREVRSRALGCVVGSLLADAAAMGVHWVYDLAVLEQLEEERRGAAAVAAAAAAAALPPSPQVAPAAPPGGGHASSGGGGRHPYAYGLEFMDPPRAPFYAYSSGRNSPYGEQTLVLLRSLAEQGGLHCGAYAAAFAAAFGPGFDGYRDVSTKGFLRNFGRGLPPPLSGAQDAQANAIARLAPLVAAFAGAAASQLQPEPAAGPQAGSEGAAAAGGGGGEGEDALLPCVALATRVTQDTDAAVTWACVGAAVLERLLVGGCSAEAAVRATLDELRQPHGRLAAHCGPLAPELAACVDAALQLRAAPVPEATAALGRNCHMPNALQTPLQVVLHVEHLVAQGRTAGGSGAAAAAAAAPLPAGAAPLPAEAYVWGVRLAVREGGCCASRAAYVGACLGARVAGGDAGLPADWLARYSRAAEVREWAAALVDARDRATALAASRGCDSGSKGAGDNQRNA